MWNTTPAEDSMSKKPFTVCPTCGTPQVNEKFSLVLYFSTVKDRNDFVEMANKELAGADAYPVYRPNLEAN